MRHSVEEAIETAHSQTLAHKSTASLSNCNTLPPLDTNIEPPEALIVPTSPTYLEPSHLEAARLLQKRCPACFGGEMKGRSFTEYVHFFSSVPRFSLDSRGGDFHSAVDGNFHHRHL